MPLFSVIIPLYNKELHIEEALKSVLSQSCVDFEIIVVNDGSTDDSALKAQSVSDDRIHLYTIENMGVSNARNYGVSKANSDFMVFLDADDLWNSNHLTDIKNLLEKFPDSGMFATAYEHKFDKKIIASDYYNIPKTSNWNGVLFDFFESSSIHCIASSSSVMIPKKIYEDIGGFNPDYNSGEDTDLWIRIALKHQVAFTNVVSAVINMTAQNQATKTNINSRNYLNFNQFKVEEKTNMSLKRYLDLNRFSIALLHKLEGNQLEAQSLINDIDTQNLNGKQRFLLQLNTSALKKLIKFKNLLRKNGFGLSAFG